QTAAIVGKDVPFPLLEAIAEEPEERVRDGLARLQAGEFLYEARLFPELEYTFRHALTHQVVYEGLLHGRRREGHAGIAGALKLLYPDRLNERIDVLAYHAFRGELWDEAVSYSRKAGLRAFSRAANVEAAAYLRQALAALSQVESSREVLEQGFDIRLELRHSLFALGDQDAIRHLLREAEVLAADLNDQVRLAQVLTFLANYFWYGAKTRDAVDTAHRALLIATQNGDPGLRATAHFRCGQANHAIGRYRRGL